MTYTTLITSRQKRDSCHSTVQQPPTVRSNAASDAPSTPEQRPLQRRRFDPELPRDLLDRDPEPNEVVVLLQSVIPSRHKPRCRSGGHRAARLSRHRPLPGVRNLFVAVTEQCPASGTFWPGSARYLRGSAEVCSVPSSSADSSASNAAAASSTLPLVPGRRRQMNNA